MTALTLPSVREVVPRRTKLGVAFGEVGGATSIVAQNTWLLYFLINIAGLRPVVAGTVFLVGRVADAFLDPIVGDYVDRHVHRMPRLHWVRLASLPFGVTFALLWLLPLLPGPVFVYALFGLVLHSVLFTAATMPLVSLTPDLARSYDARTSLTGWRVASGIVFTLVAISGPPAIVLATTGDSDLASSSGRGWVVMGVLFGLLALVGYGYAGRAIDEPRVTTPSTLAPLGRDVLRSFWAVREFRSIIVLGMVLTVAVMIGNATLPFFLESVLGMGAAEQATTLGAFFLTSILAIPVWAAVAARTGKPRALAAGTGVYMAGVLLLAGLRPTPDALPALVLVVLVAGVGLSAVTVLPLAMLPDCAEYLEDAIGERREGLLYALHAFSTKVAGSLGVFGSSIVATLVGYESGTSQQDTATELGLTVVIGPIAAAVFAVGLVLALRSPLTRSSFEAARERVLLAREQRAAALAAALAAPGVAPVGAALVEDRDDDARPSGPARPPAGGPGPVGEPGVRLVPRTPPPPDGGVLAPLATRAGLTEGQLQTAVVGAALAVILAGAGLPPVLRNGVEVVAVLPVAGAAGLPAPQSVLAPAAPPVATAPVVVGPGPAAEPVAALPSAPDLPLPDTAPLPASVPLPPSAPLPASSPSPAPGPSTPADRPAPVPATPLTVAESAWFGGGLDSVPADGLPVASRPGAERISVVRLAGTAGTLVLPLADGAALQQGEALAAVRACRVVAPGWRSGPAQPASAAPRSDCVDGVDGRRDADGRWTFELAKFPVRAGGAGFALLPGAGTSPAFQVVFDSRP